MTQLSKKDLWALGFTLIFALSAAAPARAASALPGPAFPNYANAAAVDKACTQALKGARSRIAQLERRKPDAGWLAAYDGLNAHIEDAVGPIYLLSNVHPDKAVRTATEACELRWQDLFSSLGQNPKLYAAAKNTKPRDALDTYYRQLTLEAFEDAGVGLPAGPRARAKAINDRIDKARAAGCAGGELRPPGPHAPGVRDAAARVRPRGAQQPLGHALCITGRHQHAA